MPVSEQFVWFKMTGQMWKLHVFLALSVMAGFGMVFGIWRMNHLNSRSEMTAASGLMVASTVIVTIAWTWLFLSIRCPKCRMRVAYHVVTRIRQGNWVSRLRNTRACPRCGQGIAIPQRDTSDNPPVQGLLRG